MPGTVTGDRFSEIRRCQAMSSGAAALAQHAAAFALGGAAPDADLLPALQCELETRRAHPALATHLFRNLCVLVVLRIEDAGVESPTSAEHSPFEFVFRHVMPLWNGRRGRH